MVGKTRRIVVDHPGGYDVLRHVEVETEAPKAGEVRVKVDFSGVNFADCCVRLGVYKSADVYLGKGPKCPGFEFSGVVECVGEGVPAKFSVGTKVFGVTRFFGYSDHVVVPHAQLYEVPAELTQEEAAGFTAVMLTAWYAVFNLAHPRRGQRALVHSAAGGVGGCLVQLLKAVCGCEVTGVVGHTSKVELVKGWGADRVIDKSVEKIWSDAQYDVIFDANGVETLKDSYAHLRPGGKLVVYGFHTMFNKATPASTGRLSWGSLAWRWLGTPAFNPLEMTADNKSVLAFNLSFLFDETEMFAQALSDLLGWLKEGKLTALPTTVFPASDVVSSHRAIESGMTKGKLVLKWDE